MKILALDTSTDVCSVALRSNGAVVERVELGNRHSERVLPMVQEVLAQAGIALSHLDGLAFGRGPGSFTGLRIGAGVAQGLAFGADLPVVAISSLAALAEDQDATRVLAAFDARMQQVYWGAYARTAAGLMALVGDESVVAPGAVPLPDGQQWIGAGSGWDRYFETLKRRLGERVAAWRPGGFPRAAAVARLGEAGFRAGQALPAEQAVPVYLRDQVAKQPGR